MKNSPDVISLTNRLAETPAIFTGKDKLSVPALITDLLLDAGGKAPGPAELEVLKIDYRKDRQFAMLLQICCHLLHAPWFLEQKQLAEKMLAFLGSPKLRSLAGYVAAPQFVSDPERREELVRLALDALGLLPAGENVTAARDRLTTLDSVERARLIEKTRQAQERARKLQEEVARRMAEEAEAASKMSRE